MDIDISDVLQVVEQQRNTALNEVAKLTAAVNSLQNELQRYKENEAASSEGDE